MTKYNVGDTIFYTVQDDKTVYEAKISSTSRYISVFDKLLGKRRDIVEYYIDNYCGLNVGGVVFDFQIKP
jgi:hypothetical protein